MQTEGKKIPKGKRGLQLTTSTILKILLSVCRDLAAAKVHILLVVKTEEHKTDLDCHLSVNSWTQTVTVVWSTLD